MGTKGTLVMDKENRCAVVCATEHEQQAGVSKRRAGYALDTRHSGRLFCPGRAGRLGSGRSVRGYQEESSLGRTAIRNRPQKPAPRCYHRRRHGRAVSVWARTVALGTGPTGVGSGYMKFEEELVFDIVATANAG